jgi:hypothetical protein
MVLAVVFAIAAGWSRWATNERPRPAAVELEIAPPSGSAFTAVTHLALAHDGGALVFVAMLDGISHLWLRRLESSVPRQLDNTEGAAYPFWSPDDRHVAFLPTVNSRSST